MRLKWMIVLALSFPLLEALGIFLIARAIGWWVIVWLGVAGLAGLMLIRFERTAWSLRLLSTLRSGNPLGASLFASGRVLIAGVLLLFPGMLSDIIAVILLLLPGTRFNRPATVPRAANDEILEGEFRREHDDHKPLR